MLEVTAALDSLQLDGQRATTVLGSLAHHSEELRRQQELAKQAFDDGTSTTNEFGIKNSSATAEVEKLRREGISVMCIFTGEDADLPSARRIYGRDLVRIRSIEQFADAVGGVVVQLIGNM